jgi:hypothetical protein
VPSDSRIINYWVQGSWLPNERLGLQYQLVRADAERDPFGPEATPLGAGLIGRRTDHQLRAFIRGSRSGASSLNLIFARSTWDDEAPEGPDQGVTQLGAVAALRGAAWSISGRGFWRSRWTPLDASGTIAWSPSPGLTVNVEGGMQVHEEDRSTRWVAARAGSRVGPRLVSLAGRSAQLVAAPSIESSAEQGVTDYGGRVAFERSWIGAEAGFDHTDGFDPAAFQQFEPVVERIRSVDPTDWVTFRGRLSPLSWLGIEGWYTTPREVEPDGAPPAHFVALGTIRTGFRRRFRSGAFDLKLQLGVEGWDSGVLGVAPGGAPVAIQSARHLRMHVQLRLGDFMAYFNRVNLTAATQPYVPGFPIPEYGSVFGFRWDFLN